MPLIGVKTIFGEASLRRIFETLFASVAIGAMTVALTPVFAQAQVDSVSTTDPQVYTPADFLQFQPLSAADLVSRIPGFTLQGDESDDRGFGQASLNILINGRRPSSKSSDAREILNRIPADTVTRIEIVDGASLDIPGLSGQVANIIANSGTIGGNWRYAARFEEGTEPQILEGAVNLSGKRGNLEYVLGLEAGQFTFTETGPEQFFNGSGLLIEDRREETFFQEQRPQADLNLTLNRYNGDVANLNLSGSLRNRNSGTNEFFEAVTAPGRTGQSRGNGGEDEYRYEIGGDYASELDFLGSNGRFKIIGLHNLENTQSETVFEFQEANAPLQTTRFSRDDTETEYIGRAEYTWAKGDKQDWALAIEGAFNALDSQTSIRVNNGDPFPDDVRVEEKRVEANITQSLAVNNAINLQSSLGAEFSEIEVVSENVPSRDYFRPKGFVSASYTASPTYTWRAKVERSVGQLNFNTFVSTVSLADNFETGGNDDIVPDQRWKGEIELERQDDKAISGTLRAFVDFIDDPIDRVIIREINADNNEIISEGPGNLDSATLYGVEANMTWVMDSIGFQGMRLNAGLFLADSSIEDPLTFDTRAINQTTLWNYDIELRHDIPNTPYAWEVEIEQGRQSPFFRLDNEFDTRFIRPEAQVTFIHKTLLGMQWSVTASNLFNFKSQRNRTIFSPNRLGEVVQTENFARQRGRRLSITVNDTF